MKSSISRFFRDGASAHRSSFVLITNPFPLSRCFTYILLAPQHLNGYRRVHDQKSREEDNEDREQQSHTRREDQDQEGTIFPQAPDEDTTTRVEMRTQLDDIFCVARMEDLGRTDVYRDSPKSAERTVALWWQGNGER